MRTDSTSVSRPKVLFASNSREGTREQSNVHYAAREEANARGIRLGVLQSLLHAVREITQRFSKSQVSQGRHTE
jgi:hypothetical protein